MSAKLDASALPTLDAFDDEFGREETNVAGVPRASSGFRLSTIVTLALAAAAITTLALAWPNITSWLLRPEEQKVSVAAEKPDAVIARLTREVEALRSENRELAQAQQRAVETIASLQAAEKEPPPVASWYSNAAGLTYAAPTPSAPPVRRSAAARPKPRDVPPPREETMPVSLDPQ